jgi:hypothetical protein
MNLTILDLYKWISVLYLSTKEQVSIEEVKPKHNDIIYIGKVKLQKNVLLVKLVKFAIFNFSFVTFFCNLTLPI